LAPGDEDAALAVATAWIRAAELADLQGKNQAERDALYDKTVDYLQKLTGQFPANAEVYFRLGVLASMQKQPKVAHVAYLAALDRDRDHLGSLLNLSSLMIADGDVGLAKSLLLRVIATEGVSDGLTSNERERIVRWLRESGDAAPEERAAGGDAAAANSASENSASGG
jgi:tetratricopeptide (TPR) repeat protein